MDDQNFSGGGRGNQRPGGQNSFGDRQMYQGDWTCAGCGAKITELPFEPDGERPLFCRDCYRQKRNNRPQRQF